jgi:signal transduction histidine kinase
MVEGEPNDHYFGDWAGCAGDVNHDGYSDIFICDAACGSRTGRVFVFHGSPSGLPATPNWTGIAPPERRRDWFGSVAAGVGDVDGDRYDDLLIVSNPNRDLQQPLADEIYLFRGSTNGLETHPSWTFVSPYPTSGGVQGIGRAGDVNDDGFADFFIVVKPEPAGPVWRCTVVVFHGSPNGPRAKPDWTQEFTGGSADMRVRAACAGDVNGDHIDDFIVGDMFWGDTMGQGRALVYHGSTNGLSQTPSWTATDPPSRKRLAGGAGDQRYGWSVASAGDINHDGYGDVIVGAPFAEEDDLDEGMAFLYLGSAHGLQAEPQRVFQGNEASALLGWETGSLGDVNGDGVGDLFLNAPDFKRQNRSEGAVAVFLGSTNGMAAKPHWSKLGDRGLKFGLVVASAGDVNGDGFGDLLAAETDHRLGGVEPGRVSVFYGSAKGLTGSSNWRLEKPQLVTLGQLHDRTPTVWKLAVPGLFLVALGFFVAWRQARVRLRRTELEAARAQERERLARDVHDHLGANLSQIALWSDLTKNATDAPAQVQQNLDRISTSARTALDNMSELLWTIDPAHDALADFTGHVIESAQRFLEPTELRFELDFPHPLPAIAIAPEVRTHLTMILRESLRNTVQHAHATTVTLQLRVEDHSLRFAIGDDGGGFVPNGSNSAPASGPANGRGHGLRNMRARARGLDGSLIIESSPGRGTRIVVTVPLGPPRDPDRKQPVRPPKTPGLGEKSQQ